VSRSTARASVSVGRNPRAKSRNRLKGAASPAFCPRYPTGVNASAIDHAFLIARVAAPRLPESGVVEQHDSVACAGRLLSQSPEAVEEARSRSLHDLAAPYLRMIADG
jgi:hypothetical protein